MKIRAASETDRMAVAAVQAASWKDAYRGILPDDCLDNRVTGELVRHWREIEIRAEDVVLVADEGEVIGFIAIWCRPEPFIDNLHVLPERRSKGIGGRLMAVAAQMLLRRGKPTAYLSAFEENRAAVRFYGRLGGVIVERMTEPVLKHDLPTLKVVWSDLSVIAGRVPGYWPGAR